MVATTDSPNARPPAVPAVASSGINGGGIPRYIARPPAILEERAPNAKAAMGDEEGEGPLLIPAPDAVLDSELQ